MKLLVVLVVLVGVVSAFGGMNLKKKLGVRPNIKLPSMADISKATSGWGTAAKKARAALERKQRIKKAQITGKKNLLKQAKGEPTTDKEKIELHNKEIQTKKRIKEVSRTARARRKR